MLAVCVHCTTPTGTHCSDAQCPFQFTRYLNRFDERMDGSNEQMDAPCFICFHLLVCPIQLLVNVVVVARLLPFHFILPLCLHIESSIVYVWARHICYRFISSISFNIALKFLVYLGKRHKNKAQTHLYSYTSTHTHTTSKNTFAYFLS